MAHQSGPMARIPIIRSSELGSRYELKIHEIQPESLTPNGDRYVVEMIEVDETMEFGAIMVVMQQPTRGGTPGAGQAAQMEARGVLPAVIITRGNGHLLGLPDPAFMTKHPDGIEHIVREHADVPMFFEAGDIVFVDHNARGRALRIVGREVRVVNQMDVLLKLEGAKLVRENGKWVAFKLVGKEWVRAE